MFFVNLKYNIVALYLIKNVSMFEFTLGFLMLQKEPIFSVLLHD